MFAIIGSLGFIVSLDTFRDYSLRDERNLIVSALHKARSQSVNNMCFTAAAPCTDGKPHGVRIEAGQYVIFQGPDFAGRDTAVDEIIKSVYAPAATTGFTEVVFSPLSANAATLPAGTWTLSVSDSMGNTSVIIISGEGRVTWTN